MLTTHIKRNIFGVFLSFANFYLFLVMQMFLWIFWFCKFLWVSCKVMKAVKINDTSYLSWGSSAKLASGSLQLIGVESHPAAVCLHSSWRCNCKCSMSWSLLPVWHCHSWDISMCWCSVSCMLSLCTRSSPSCWVMAPKPRDEAVRLMRFKASLELMWVLWLLR